MMKWTIKEADLHVTTVCSGRCEYCYVDHGKTNPLFKKEKAQGDTETLKSIIRNIRVAGGAEDIVFVGGDPCQHSDLYELLEHAKRLGLNTCVLSNTHVYRYRGIMVPMEKVVGVVDEMDFTLHGTPSVHNAFNGNCCAYEAAVGQIKQFISLRGEEQSVGVIINLTPENVKHLDETLRTFLATVPLDPARDTFLVQRIAPVGRARENYDRWKITREMVQDALTIFEAIRKDFGIGVKLDAIDVFPWCAVPEEYHYMLTPGGCQWGQPGGILSVTQDGEIQRCALSGKNLGNFIELDTPEKFEAFYRDNQTLNAFREKRHLPEGCLKCEYFEQCGGGCIIATGGDPYASETIPVASDYLA